MKNRTVVEKAEVLMSEENLPRMYWVEAVSTAAYIMNRSPTLAFVNATPLQIWIGVKPDISYHGNFGCTAMVLVPKQKRLKWDETQKS